MANPCAALWQSITTLASQFAPRPSPSTQSAAEHGHANGVDDDLTGGLGEGQGAGAAATEAAGDSSSDQTTGTCPTCKVAIVIGHNSVRQGADSAGVSEYVYNGDIADRTLQKIEEQGGGKITAQIFRRTNGSGEMARVYAQVNSFLDGVASNKKIAIELHYNSVATAAARRSETLYKGDVGFATRTAVACAAVFGGRGKAKHYTENPRGQATFTNGPTNTYLMEPFFGSNPESAEIALSESGRDKLADIYASELVDWVG